MKTIKEMFNETRLEAENLVRYNKIDVIIYLSGTVNKRNKYQKMLTEYVENSNVDFELGVISEDIHLFEMKSAQIIKKSIDNFVVFK